MTFAFIASASANGAASATTAAIDTTGATLLIIGIAYSVTGSVADSQLNTWTGLTVTAFNGVSCRIFYCISPTTNSAHTFTVTGSVPSISASAFSSSGGTPTLDVQQGGSVTTGTFATVGDSALTPTQNNCLVLNANGSMNPGFGTYAAASGWTVASFKDVPATSFPVGVVYQIQTTATSIPSTQHTTVFGNSCTTSNRSVSFYETAGGGGTALPRNCTLTGAGY